MQQSDGLAPCVVVAGPANSGKTTLLHFLDRALAQRPSRPMTYVVKGSPDGTGRYLLYRTKEEREALKERVKGSWTEPTVDRICEWIRNARRYLDLALVDFGGKRGGEVQASNLKMLRECTHSIVLARRFETEAEEAAKGLAAWRGDCREAGLKEVAAIESLWERGEAEWGDDGGLFRGSIRADRDQPNDGTNAGMVTALAERLESLPQPGRMRSYIDLFRPGGWDAADPYGQLEEYRPVLRRLALGTGPVPLGGKTAIFAYLLATHAALEAQPDTAVTIFDPKIAWGLVDIPALAEQWHPEFPYRDLSVTLSAYEDGVLLDIRLIARDKFLPPTAAEHLRFAPAPLLPGGRLRKAYVTGGAPSWLHAAYSRWLARRGFSEIWLNDQSSGRYIRVKPSGPAGAVDSVGA